MHLSCVSNIGTETTDFRPNFKARSRQLSKPEFLEQSSKILGLPVRIDVPAGPWPKTDSPDQETFKPSVYPLAEPSEAATRTDFSGSLSANPTQASS